MAVAGRKNGRRIKGKYINKIFYFYYLDPRYDGEDGRSQINVSDENIPDPRMGAILAEDIKENPHNYYIWRTCKDDKVRARIKTTLKCCFYRKRRSFLT